MHKLGIAYTQHFNKRYDRTGSLFESTFKVVHVENDAQLLHLPRYVHCNALDLTALNWREGQVKDWGVAQSFLDSFPWSSHRVYMGDKQELPVIDLAEARKIFPDVASYTSFLRNGRHENFRATSHPVRLSRTDESVMPGKPKHDPRVVF